MKKKTKKLNYVFVSNITMLYFKNYKYIKII